MPTIVDSLIVTLGLDPAPFAKGSKEADAAFAKTREEVTKTGQGIEKHAKDSAEFLGKLRNQVLLLFAAFTGGKGLAEFARDVTATDAETGRLAKTLDTTTETLSAWRGVVVLAGGSAAGITGAIQGLVSQFQHAALTGQSSVIPYFRALGVSIADANDRMRPTGDILLDLADKFSQMDPARAAEYGRNLGFDQGTINLLLQGRAAVQGMLNEQQRLGVITDRDAKAGQALQKAWGEFTQAATTFGRRLLTDITPGLVAALHGLTDFAVWLQTKEPAIEKAFTGIADAMGGWKALTIEVVGIYVGAKVLGMLAILARIAGAFRTIEGAAVAAKVAQVGAAEVGTGAAAAGGAAAAAGVGVGTAAVVGAAVVGAAGLAAGAYGAFKTGEGVANAGTLGFRPSGTDEFGNPTGFVNPTTHEQLDVFEMQKRIEDAQKRAAAAAPSPVAARLAAELAARQAAAVAGGPTPVPLGTTPPTAPSTTPPTPSAAGPAAPPTAGDNLPPGVAGNKEAFIQAVTPLAQQAGAESGVDPRIIIAQAGIESGWGAHAPGNNYFGIKGPGGSYATQEFVNGKMVTVQQSFAGYSSMAESFKAYAQFIKNNPRYGAMRAAPDVGSQVAALGASGYATDPNYASKISTVVAGLPPIPTTPGAPAPTQVATATAPPTPVLSAPTPSPSTADPMPPVVQQEPGFLDRFASILSSAMPAGLGAGLASLAAKAPYPMQGDLGSLAGAPAAAVASNIANDNSSVSTTTHETNINALNVYTQAKDAAGIARDIKPAIQRSTFAFQSNYGLA